MIIKPIKMHGWSVNDTEFFHIVSHKREENDDNSFYTASMIPTITWLAFFIFANEMFN